MPRIFSKHRLLIPMFLLACIASNVMAAPINTIILLLSGLSAASAQMIVPPGPMAMQELDARLTYARMGILNEADLLRRYAETGYYTEDGKPSKHLIALQNEWNRTLAFDEKALAKREGNLRGANGPFDYCYAKLLPGWYCTGHTSFYCDCDISNFPFMDCRTLWQSDCPGGCAGDKCIDVAEKCADGWVYEPTCADIIDKGNTADLQFCEHYFGTGSICHVRQRVGTLPIAHSTDNIRRKALAAFNYLESVDKAYDRMVIGPEEMPADLAKLKKRNMEDTEERLACERFFPACLNDHWEGAVCKDLVHQHNIDFMNFELACRSMMDNSWNTFAVRSLAAAIGVDSIKSGTLICNTAEKMPNSACSKSDAQVTRTMPGLVLITISMINIIVLL